MPASLHTILVVAKNTFRETIRNKVLYAILAFAAVYMLFTLFLGSISLGEDLHVIRSLGLAGMYIFGLIITIFLGSSLLYKELERRTLYFVLSKPISRAHLVLGKFLGLLSSVAVCLAGMTVLYLLMVAFKGGGFDSSAILAVFYQLLEMSLLIALTIFFSTFSMPLLSTLYAVLVVYIGHSLDLLMQAVQGASAPVRFFVQLLHYVLPNLAKFDIRSAIIYDASVPLSQALLVVAYAAMYVGLLLCVAVFLFEKREI